MQPRTRCTAGGTDIVFLRHGPPRSFAWTSWCCQLRSCIAPDLLLVSCPPFKPFLVARVGVCVCVRVCVCVFFFFSFFFFCFFFILHVIRSSAGASALLPFGAGPVRGLAKVRGKNVESIFASTRTLSSTAWHA